ncbi:MAG TPA: GDYXXLXY domain-containing protein [Chthoniobacterales bacterium]|nr:GDYXXLXY domain-containing protein [Chthoniobacterales bacterium]
MKTFRIAIFVLIAIAQLSIPAMMAWGRVQTLAHGRVWKLKTAPIDPEDAVRGRYVMLRFDAEDTYRQPEQLKSVDSLYAILKEGPDGFATVDHLSHSPTPSDSAVKVEPGGFWDGQQRIVFPFRYFWVTEKNAPAAEKAYRENSKRRQQNAFVTVRIRNGDSALEQLYIDNKPLAEYLRAEAADK